MGASYQVFSRPSGCSSFSPSLVELIAAEVPEHDRFYELRLELDIFHRKADARSAWASSGRTIRWHRDNVLVALDRAVPPGSSVELTVRWSPGVQLILQGRVSGDDPRGTFINIRRRRFRGKPQLFGAPRARVANRRPHRTAGVVAAVLLAAAASGGSRCN